MFDDCETIAKREMRSGEGDFAVAREFLREPATGFFLCCPFGGGKIAFH